MPGICLTFGHGVSANTSHGLGSTRCVASILAECCSSAKLVPDLWSFFGAAKPTGSQTLAEKYQDATDFPLQLVDMMGPGKRKGFNGFKRHSAKLVNRLLYGSSLKFRRWRGKRVLTKNVILPLYDFDDQFAVSIDQALNDTAFEKLMSEVLNEFSIGTTAAFAEPDVGKSIATTLAVLKMEATQSKLTVMLRGGFKRNLKRFFRLEDVGDVEDVARCVFWLLKNHGICLQLVFDNAFDAGLEKGLIIALGRLALEHGHNLIVIVRSKEMAIEVANLNGDRTRIARQQQGSIAEEYRWSEHLARQYLNSTVITECQRHNGSFDDVMCRWLNATQTRDQLGGWKPFDMNLCISGISGSGAFSTLGRRIA